MAIPTQAVKGILVFPNKEFILLKRNLREKDIENYDLPGGLVEKEEDFEIALLREINEELYGCDEDLYANVKIVKKSNTWQFLRPKDGKIVQVQNYICKILNENMILSDEHQGIKKVTIKTITDYKVKDESLYKALKEESYFF